MNKIHNLINQNPPNNVELQELAVDPRSVDEPWVFLRKPGNKKTDINPKTFF